MAFPFRMAIAATVSVVPVSVVPVSVVPVSVVIGAAAARQSATPPAPTSLIAARQRASKESAAREILRQVPSEGSEPTPPSTHPPAGPPLPSEAPAGQLGQRIGPTKEGAVGRYQELMAVRGQQLSNEVTAAIAEARRAGVADPDSAIALLKREREIVTTASDVEPQLRDELSRRLLNTVQELRSIQEHQQTNRLNNAERLAQVEAQRKSLEQMSLSETRLTELID